MVQYMNLTRLSGKKTIFSRKKWMLFVSFALERNKNKNLFTCVVYSIHVYESLERTSVHCVIPSQYCFMDVFAHSVLRHNIIYCWIYFVYSSDGSILMISLRNEKKEIIHNQLHTKQIVSSFAPCDAIISLAIQCDQFFFNEFEWPLQSPLK